MKYQIKIFAFIFFILSCDNFSKKNPNNQSNIYGESFIYDKVVPVSELKSKMNGKELACVIEGNVTKVCKKEGCWVRLNDGSGDGLFVTTDEKFFLPKDCEGKTLLVNGYAYNDTTSIEQLIDYAKDEGKSEEEIALIKEPLVESKFYAKGVIIK